MKIAIAASHAMEFTTFRRYMGKVQKLPLKQWQHYLWDYSGNQVILLETGIGPKNAYDAFLTLLDGYKIDCAINFGSAGMINGAYQVGDAFLAVELVDRVSEHVIKTDAGLTEAIAAFLDASARPFHRGRLLTSPEPVAKASHRARLAEKFHVCAVDMEAYALAEAALKKRIPFASLKMFSDCAKAFSRLEYWKNLPHVDRALGKLMHGFLDQMKAA
jgi:adenosylhomocysteine nucleosidase